MDNGIGMTEDEVKKYITQVAFSGAEDFLAKYKEQSGEENQIIGHFGLGFYSAFMVSTKVEIDTLSYVEGSESVKWICEGGTDYEIEASNLTKRGTTITLYINEEDKDFLEEYKLREVIVKHCAFLPYEIYLTDENAEIKKPDEEVVDKVEAKTEEKVEEKPLNDIHPLWLKDPKDCTDEEYKAFYKSVFNDYNDPLFWIHLKVDYPFELKGILYFPKLKHELDASEGQIKLYNNQVFVADNIKEIIPEFLLLLKGVVDCSDLPLNVSRSFLQKDKNVIKISRHITKKVGDKLNELYKNDKEKYEGFWNDISPFVKYGCLREDSFYENIKDVIIFKTTSGKYETLKEYLDKNENKHKNKIFYVNDEKQQAQYIKMFKDHDLEAVILNSSIDNHFISFLEMHLEGVTFNRIDSDLSDTLKDPKVDEKNADEEITGNSLQDVFKENLNNDKLTIKAEALKTTDIPAIMLLSEHSRRMQEMSSMFGGGMNMGDMFTKEETLIVNLNNPLIKRIISLNDLEDKKDTVKMICEQVYDLARMSHEPLDSNAMSKFLERSNLLLSKVAE